MKVTNINYKSINDLDKNLDLSSLDTNKTLIQIFSGFVLEDEIRKITKLNL